MSSISLRNIANIQQTWKREDSQRKPCGWKCVLLKTGYDYTADQVSGRWKSLMRAYKNTKDNNKRYGSGENTFIYESQFDETQRLCYQAEATWKKNRRTCIPLKAQTEIKPEYNR